MGSIVLTPSNAFPPPAESRLEAAAEERKGRWYLRKAGRASQASRSNLAGPDGERREEGLVPLAASSRRINVVAVVCQAMPARRGGALSNDISRGIPGVLFELETSALSLPRHMRGSRNSQSPRGQSFNVELRN